jgi:hypothetical protein
MGNTIKVAAEIRINDLPMTRVDQLMGLLQRRVLGGLNRLLCV